MNVTGERERTPSRHLDGLREVALVLVWATGLAGVTGLI